ncbi:hypothetical protein AYO20_05736 [Fonsecaea nubica]|uniref:Zn(2)-C6 fungal-type domain-containing protein n=1 Tax=Fonsecaea nubica TaxID=856822 RepID=A0A178D1D9_9EURO|nr:hypothetical protein AYO20_05736 [Fonsecaea nubica]OAL35021.1 hypothetical protein AYO20_05736 [Fonsecaea nubica]
MDDNKSSLAAPDEKPRVKQLHHKVRSGCITCKRRRIKCDEEKPTCQRCIRSGKVCLGYDPPRAWIFDVVKSKKRNETQCSKEPPEILPLEDGGGGENSSQPAEYFSTWCDPYLTTAINVSFGDTQEERRSLDFWLKETGPTLGNFGPDNDFWCGFIPRWAWQSPILRHLMVAAAMVDEQLGLYRKAMTSRVTPRVFWHYHAAITRMATAKASDKLCLTVACLVAWICETMQRNYMAAAVHIKAASRLWGELKASSARFDRSTLDTMAPIERAVRVCESYAYAVLTEETPSSSPLLHGTGLVGERDCDVPVVHSLTQARGLLLDSIAAFSTKDWTESDARRQRLFVRNWHQAIRRYCSHGPESRLYKITVQMLFNVGMAFLPETEAGIFSYYANPNALKHILDVFEQILKERQKEKPSPDDENVEETLVFALEVMLNNIRHDKLHQRAQRLRRTLRRPCRYTKCHAAVVDGDLNAQSAHIAQVLTLSQEQRREDLDNRRT